MVLNTKRHDGTDVKITIKFVKQLQFGDFQYTQVFNFIVRKVMAMLDLKLVGKNFYDPKAKVRIFYANLLYLSRCSRLDKFC
jgi:aubergine